MMPLEISSQIWPVHVLTQQSEMDMVATFLTLHSDNSRHLFFPVLNDFDSAVCSASARLWSEHEADPHSTWIFVLNPDYPPISTATTTTPRPIEQSHGPILGLCQWRLYPSNPFPFPPGEPPESVCEAYWWPPGGSRAFTSEYMRQIVEPRSRWMSRAHSGMSWMAVHPAYRRKGIGTALMEWGIQQTDAMGVESYVEGTAMGAKLYASCGYVCVKETKFNMENVDEERKDGEWAEWQRKLDEGFLPPSFASMWRPVEGRLVEGEMEKTWSARLAL